MESYSVVIRTTGKAGEKYKRLLESINKLNPKPVEVIVVLPEGVKPPEEKLGWEKFYFSPKGMVIQRLVGIRHCKTKYALISDDDIAFDSDFVRKLYEPLKDGTYSLSAGPLIEFFPRKGKQTILSTIIGSAVPTVFHKNRYNTVLRTTGYSFNRKLKPGNLYETQTAPWTCFFANIEDLKKINFEEEIWLDKHGYSSHDDTCMFYKAWLMGKKTVVVSDAFYQHLDAKTSTRGNNLNAVYSSGFNTYIFWHRFIYSLEKNTILKLWSVLCIHYLLFMSQCITWYKFRITHSISREVYEAKKNGISEGKKWVKSDEYLKLPNIKG